LAEQSLSAWVLRLEIMTATDGRNIYITGYGHNTLYRNNGDGTFTDVQRKNRGWACGMVHGRGVV